jgi:hypothetical protein
MSRQRLAVLVAIAVLALADPGEAATGRVPDQAASNLRCAPWRAKRGRVVG